METLVLAFILMLLVFLGMAIGFLVQRKPIKGSCGGISALGMDKACDCDKPCDRRKERMDYDEHRSTREQSWQEKRIY